jgi:hypothetical protein
MLGAAGAHKDIKSSMASDPISAIRLVKSIGLDFPSAGIVL